MQQMKICRYANLTKKNIVNPSTAHENVRFDERNVRAVIFSIPSKMFITHKTLAAWCRTKYHTELFMTNVWQPTQNLLNFSFQYFTLGFWPQNTWHSFDEPISIWMKIAKEAQMAAFFKDRVKINDRDETKIPFRNEFSTNCSSLVIR